MLLTRSGTCSYRQTAIRRLLSTFATVQPIVELREYELHPEHSVTFVQATAKTVDLRKSLVPLRLFSLPETGGPLHVATHAYYYAGGHAERDHRRALQVQNEDWKLYIAECRPYVQRQQSNIYIEAPLVQKIDEIVGLEPVLVPKYQQNISGQSILEIRRYRLRLGYDTVPQFLSLYETGISSKLRAPGTDPTTSLVTLLSSEVGRLNEVIEIWRHGDGTSAMEKSRAAARNASEWRNAIANIASLAIEFTSTIHKPTPFSPLQ